MAASVNEPPAWTSLPDLASEGLGTEVQVRTKLDLFDENKRWCPGSNLPLASLCDISTLTLNTRTDTRTGAHG